jgi:hypothetical protein
MKKKIHLIITGGTIDKVYDPVSQTTQMAPESIIPLYLKNAINPALHDLTYETPFMVDSNDITEPMRKKILGAITSSKENWIIITHGTDTMSVTAEFLKEQFTAHPWPHDYSHRLHDSLARIHAQRRQLQSRLRHQRTRTLSTPAFTWRCMRRSFPPATS